MMPLGSEIELCQLADGSVDGCDGLERAAPEHTLGELDAERLLDGEHQVDARMGCEPCLVEARVVVQLTHGDGQTAVLSDDCSNSFVPHRRLTHPTKLTLIGFLPLTRCRWGPG